MFEHVQKRRAAEEAARRAGRLPAGQSLTAEGKWPVLHEGPIPAFDRASWDFRIWSREGLVAERRLGYDELLAVAPARLQTDFHCVTTWSKLDMTWEGVRVKDLLAATAIDPRARVVMVHAEHGYTANVPLDDLRRDEVMLASRVDGADLAPEHGYPLRLVVPHLYAWKSVKWVRGFELLARDRPGYWEQRGYHMRGDPWKEERYG
ncbi:MAG: sulfite oxidase-like oxidoreductase [Acidobacteriota bacterium]